MEEDSSITAIVPPQLKYENNQQHESREEEKKKKRRKKQTAATVFSTLECFQRNLIFICPFVFLQRNIEWLKYQLSQVKNKNKNTRLLDLSSICLTLSPDPLLLHPNKTNEKIFTDNSFLLRQFIYFLQSGVVSFLFVVVVAFLFCAWTYLCVYICVVCIEFWK